MSDDYSDDILPPGENALKTLADLAQQQADLEASVASAEAGFKALKKQLAAVAEKLLPEAMAEIGMAEFTLENGTKIKVKDGLNASLTGQYKAPAIQWLHDSEHTTLLQCQVTIDVPSYEAGVEVKKELEKNGLPGVGISQAINTASFKALVKECLAEGEEVPLAKVGVSPWKRSQVTTS